MKVSKWQSQPEIVAAAFLILYMVLGSPIFVPGFDCDSCLLLVTVESAVFRVSLYKTQILQVRADFA